MDLMEKFNPQEHLMNLKGKKYLQVMWRLVWFRQDKPNWCIDTKLEHLTDNHAVFNAKIFDEDGMQKASGYGSEGIKDFRDFIEKAETKAIGRALAMLGYGTQFAPELDEGERIVDSPVPEQPDPEPKIFCKECGAEIIPVKKGDKIISPQEIADFSVANYGMVLCTKCRKLAKAATAGDPSETGF